jgi:hypothetical protein
VSYWENVREAKRWKLRGGIGAFVAWWFVWRVLYRRGSR